MLTTESKDGHEIATFTRESEREGGSEIFLAIFCVASVRGEKEKKKNNETWPGCQIENRD